MNTLMCDHDHTQKDNVYYVKIKLYWNVVLSDIVDT